MIVVRPGDSAAEIINGFHRHLENRAAVYRASLEGQRAAREAEERRQHHQREHDALVELLPLAATAQSALVAWLARFSVAADHVGIEGSDLAFIADTLEAAGYARSACCGLGPDAYLRPEIMARYLAGQAIDLLRRGMPPHPITQKFAADYEARLLSGAR